MEGSANRCTGTACRTPIENSEGILNVINLRRPSSLIVFSRCPDLPKDWAVPYAAPAPAANHCRGQSFGVPQRRFFLDWH
jgi:hypothetical protein